MSQSSPPSFLDRVLQVPRYGYERDGTEYFPSFREVVAEIFHNANVFRSKKNWIGAVSFFLLINGTVMTVHYFTNYFSFSTLAIGYLIFLIDYPLCEAIAHRGYNHRAFRPQNRFCFFIVKALSSVDLPEEISQVAHTVHHYRSDQPGDPYNPRGGFIYSYFSDFIHHSINRDLSRKDYEKLRDLLKDCMIYQNSYEQYQRWGTVANPWFWSLEKFCHFAIRYSPLIFLGKEYFYAYFAVSYFNILIFFRTMNYFNHGGGRPRQRVGLEFHQGDLSINHWSLYLMTGQRHNFHHHFPESANNAFLPRSIDHAFVWIKILEKLRIIKDVKNAEQEYLTKYYLPHQQAYSVALRTKLR